LFLETKCGFYLGIF